MRPTLLRRNCHPERSEGSGFSKDARCFALLSMTTLQGRRCPVALFVMYGGHCPPLECNGMPGSARPTRLIDSMLVAMVPHAARALLHSAGEGTGGTFAASHVKDRGGEDCRDADGDNDADCCDSR